ncbi:MAG: hypothetical protein R3D33_16945 [Hyphomicrobiaceae bacterium]
MWIWKYAVLPKRLAVTPAQVEEFIERVRACAVFPDPRPEDCLHCQRQVRTILPNGAIIIPYDPPDHLARHVREGRLEGSLLMMALHEWSTIDEADTIHEVPRPVVLQALTDYLFHSLLPGHRREARDPARSGQ